VLTNKQRANLKLKSKKCRVLLHGFDVKFQIISFFRCSDFCLIFTELCNSLSYYLLNESNTDLSDFNCINLLLMCGTHEDYEVFQKSFVFWFNISEEIYTNVNSENLCRRFRDYTYALIDCICKHCRLSPNHVSKSSRKRVVD
jgi:hypothetical protein